MINDGFSECVREFLLVLMNDLAPRDTSSMSLDQALQFQENDENAESLSLAVDQQNEEDHDAAPQNELQIENAGEQENDDQVLDGIQAEHGSNLFSTQLLQSLSPDPTQQSMISNPSPMKLDSPSNEDNNDDDLKEHGNLPLIQDIACNADGQWHCHGLPSPLAQWTVSGDYLWIPMKTELPSMHKGQPIFVVHSKNSEFIQDLGVSEKRRLNTDTLGDLIAVVVYGSSEETKQYGTHCPMGLRCLISFANKHGLEHLWKIDKVYVIPPTAHRENGPFFTVNRVARNKLEKQRVLRIA